MDIRSFFSPKASKGAPPKPSPTTASSKSSTSKNEKPKPSSKSKPETKSKSSNQKATPKKEKKTIQVDEDDDDDEVLIIENTPQKGNKNKSKDKNQGKEKKEENGKNSNKHKLDKSKSDLTSQSSRKKDSKTVDNNNESEKEVDVVQKEDSKKGGKKKEPKREKGSERPSPKKKHKMESSDEECVQVARKRTDRKKTKKGMIFDSDSEEEEEDPLPKSKGKSNSKKKKKDTVLISDSDEDSPRKPREKEISNFFKPQSAKKPGPQKSKKEPEKKKEVSVMDFFGAATVKRTERKAMAGKRKAEDDLSPVKSKRQSVAEEDVKTEDVEMFDDDEDFEATLKQLDDIDKKSKKKKQDLEPLTVPETPQRSPKKPESAKTSPTESPKPAKGSISSKLAARARASKTTMEFTPKREEVKTKSPAKVSPVKTVKHEKVKSPAKVKTPEKKTPAKATSVSPVEESSAGPKKGSGYRAYLHREAPRSLGCKEVPEAGENCLEGLTFVITGVLESFERDEMKSAIEKYGGKVTGSLSKKTSYVVVGRDAGESKLNKARQFGTTELDEDGVLALLRSKPGKKSKYEIAAEQSSPKAKSTPTLKKFSSKQETTLTPSASPKVKPMSRLSQGSQSSQASQRTASPQKSSQSEPSLLWVDKYKPVALKSIIGQQGDKSNAKKLLHWLRSWHRNQASGAKPAGNRWSDDGAGFKAALLSGPPGVGKTTTATLVCKEMGFSFVELNASDTRSKKSLQQEVSEALNNHTLVDFFGGKKTEMPKKINTHLFCLVVSTAQHAGSGQKHCLVMDEVDGMAGNEDRGGMQELIQLIKGSKIPIICMCNDRNHPKIRSLVNHCFDLRFQRPRVEQIKAAMMSMAFKEGLKIPPPALNEIIIAANQDIRQVIHNISMWSASDKAMTYDQCKADAKNAKKDFKLGPFDVCRKVFAGGEETAGMTIHDKSDLFFHDYSIAPLFVQENYASVSPFAARGDIKKHLDLLSKAADSICDGDLVDKQIRSNQAWSLLPTMAIMSSVIPGEIMRGGMGGMIQFPQWLGKNSAKNRVSRLVQELRTHMRLKISANNESLNMEYFPHLRNALTQPLVRLEGEGVPVVMETMMEYDLLREDYDNIVEVAQWSNRKDPMSQIPPKVKAAFTRAYNKEGIMTPYSYSAPVKKKRGGGGGGGADLLGEEGEEGAAVEEEEEDEGDPLAGGMIKVKKPSKATKGADSKKGKGSAAAKGKGTTAAKGKGKGKGKK